MNDARFALRSLGRTPAFTAIAVVTLALGIGANTAIFSLVHTVILKPLPFRDPDRLVAIWDTYLPQYEKLGVSSAEAEAWQQQTDLFADSAWYRHIAYNFDLVMPGAEAVEVHGAFASDRFLPLLGVAPAIGRGFTAGEPPTSVLLSDRLWQSRFKRSRDAIGRAIRLNEQEFTVIGVMPPDFRFPDWADLWLPPGPLLADEPTNPVQHAKGWIARLRPGVTREQVVARVHEIALRLAAERPKTSRGFGVRVYGLQEDLTANMRPALLMLLGAVALVLLIACANVANLLLSRASGRTREIAARTALGAGAWRLMRQFVTESLVLAGAGGALGMVFAEAGLRAFSPVRAPIETAVLLFLVAVSLATGVLFGLAPVVQILRVAPAVAMKSGALPGGGSGRVRSVLVVFEFALALMLATGAGILAKSFLHLVRVDPGFDSRGILTVRLSVPPSRKPSVLYPRIEQRLLSIAGVRSVAVANTLPLIADRSLASRFNVPGSPLINPDALPAAQTRFISPGYFEAMGLPLRSGRAFTALDLNQPVVIVNQTMAQRFWPGQDPVGRKFITGVFGATPSYSTIVGVAADVKQFGLDSEPTMDLYYPVLAPRYLILRTAGDPQSLAAAAEREMRSIDAGIPVSDIRTMDAILAESAGPRRWTMALLAAFAALAVVLALVGIYGVMSWSVAQRTREIGIRIALGADRAQVLRMTIGHGLRLSVVGLALGLAGALALRRVLSSLVFEVSTADPATYAVVPVLMLGVALLACWVPARRASRVDPSIALRWE